MILVDTSVWVDHLTSTDVLLRDLLLHAQVVTHPWVIGELSAGSYQNRSAVMTMLAKLPTTVVATDAEVLGFIERKMLFGCGIGYVDCGLIASARLTNGVSLWTRDKRLHLVAERLSIASRQAH